MASGARNQQAAMLRRSSIVDLARERGSLNVADLPAHFGVSAETIRRDLRYLEDHGQVSRAYGTLRATETSAFERSYRQRFDQNSAEKHRIAKAASTHVGDAAVIFVDEGFLPSLVAAALPADRPLTVVTTSLQTAHSVSSQPTITAIIVGGKVRSTTYGVVDYWATSMLGSMEIDLAFIGANGVTDEGWLTTPDPAVAATKRAAMDASHRKILIADHSKFGRHTFARFASTREFECVITGKELRESTARSLGRLGAPVIRT